MKAIVMACDDDAITIWDIINKVDKEINDTNIFYADDFQYVKQHIKDSGFTLLCNIDNNVAGYLMVRTPFSSEDNLGFDCGYDSQKALSVAHIESLAVLEPFRGNGLQNEMMVEAERILKARGFKYFMATVSPKNLYSLHNFIKFGYIVVDTKIKYGGNERHILLKELPCNE